MLLAVRTVIKNQEEGRFWSAGHVICVFDLWTFIELLLEICMSVTLQLIIGHYFESMHIHAYRIMYVPACT